MTNFLNLPTFAGSKLVHVVVESPRHVNAKFKYSPALEAFVLSRALRLGFSYPCDWGFVPSTRAPDGDPIDALVLHNVTTNPGMVLCCRPIGILQVQQTRLRQTMRNDRLMMVPIDSAGYRNVRSISDPPASLKHQAEEFFVAATAGTGKSLKFLGWRGPVEALAAIKRSHKAFQRSPSAELT